MHTTGDIFLSVVPHLSEVAHCKASVTMSGFRLTISIYELNTNKVFQK